MRFRISRGIAGVAGVLVLVVGLILFNVGGIGSAIQRFGRAPADPIVDGWVVGREECALATCQEIIDVATPQLAARDPGHAAIVRASVHVEGRYYNDAGDQLLVTRSGGPVAVVRFELADGSVQAIGAGFPGISQTLMAFDYGPLSSASP